MGDTLGGRPEDQDYYYSSGKVDYGHLATAPFFVEGIAELVQLARTASVAFMCSEADFRKCHRYWLITRTLVGRGIEVNHILHSGELIGSTESEFTPEQPGLF